MKLEGKVINFLGDSITQGVGVSCTENIYLNRIAANYHLKKANNYGISGTRFARQYQPSENPSFDQDFCSRVDGMDENADAIVVFGSTNDYGHGDAPLGNPEDRTKDTFYGACHELMTRLLTRYPGKIIVFCTPLHRLNEDCPCGSRKPAPVGTLDEYIAILKQVARYYAIPVLDLNAVSGIQPNLPILMEKFCPDGLHPNDAGHALLAERIANFLMTL